MIKEMLMKKFKVILTSVLNTKLTSRNIVKAINIYTIEYSIGVIKWAEM